MEFSEIQYTTRFWEQEREMEVINCSHCVIIQFEGALQYFSSFISGGVSTLLSYMTIMNIKTVTPN